SVADPRAAPSAGGRANARDPKATAVGGGAKLATPKAVAYPRAPGRGLRPYPYARGGAYPRAPGRRLRLYPCARGGRRLRPYPCARGMTLIEILIVLTLIGIVMGIV